MAEITAAGRVPLLVGGTMMYFKRLVEGVANLPSADAEVRAELERDAERLGLAGLHEALARVDPAAAERIHPNDPQRLMRALEVYRISGRSLTELWHEQRPETFPWRPLSIGLAPADRGVLHARIARRFDAMLEAGFLDEMAALKARGDLTPGAPVDEERGLSSGVGIPRGRGRSCDLSSPRHRGHPPAGQASADLDAPLAGAALGG